MTCKPFSINVPEAWFIKATEEIKNVGGSFQGNAASGEFSVSVPVLGVVAGKYVVDASVLQITITQKPFLPTCASIEAFVRQRFGGGRVEN
jgi:hypothetical protein